MPGTVYMQIEIQEIRYHQVTLTLDFIFASNSFDSWSMSGLDFSCSFRFVLLSFLAITFTIAYSTKAAKTKTIHVAIQTSMAFGYETRGIPTRAPENCVVMVSTVVTPNEILAGTASWFIQNAIQERMTMRMDGT